MATHEGVTTGAEAQAPAADAPGRGERPAFGGAMGQNALPILGAVGGAMAGAVAAGVALPGAAAAGAIASAGTLAAAVWAAHRRGERSATKMKEQQKNR